VVLADEGVFLFVRRYSQRNLRNYAKTIHQPHSRGILSRLHIIHPDFLSKRKRRLILEKYFYRKSKKRTFRINARSFFSLKDPSFFCSGA